MRKLRRRIRKIYRPFGWFKKPWAEFKHSAKFFAKELIRFWAPVYRPVLKPVYVFTKKTHLRSHFTRMKRYPEKALVFWGLPLVIVVLLFGLFIKPRIKYPLALSSVKILGYFEAAHQRDLGERINFWSEKILKTPSVLSTLGAGPKINDTVPLFTQHFDCTTFVETVAALARSKTSVELADRLIEIRYRNGHISFASRNHFPEADWIPNNENTGILHDITAKIASRAGLDEGYVEKDIDKAAWFRRQGSKEARALAANDDREHVRLAYISINDIPKALKHLPQGAVINFVRENHVNKDVLITHQGFLIWKNGKAYFRHVTNKRQVAEILLTGYLAYMRAAPWKVLGININEFRG